MEQVLASPEEVAQILGVSRTTVSRWRRDNKAFPPAFKIGPQAVRFKVADVLIFVEAERAKVAPSEVE